MSKELKPVDELRLNVQRLEGEFKKALPSQIPVEKFVRVVITAIMTNPDLVTANRNTFFAACMKAASDGLLPDSREAALVIFKTKTGPAVVYMPMVQGILKKVRNSGELTSIASSVIYEHDSYRFWTDDSGEHMTHEALVFGDRGIRIGAYAMAKTKDGGLYVEVMSLAQIMDVKNISKAKDFGPWSGPFEDEMFRKTVVRRLCKRLPMNTDLDDVIRRDDEMYEVEETKTPQIESSSSSRLAKLIDTGDGGNLEANWDDKAEVAK